jgi:hypothetical protein
MEKVVTLTTRIERTCDCCKAVIPERIMRHTYLKQCVVCKADLCYECCIKLSHKVKLRAYRYADEYLGCICKPCCNALGIALHTQEEAIEDIIPPLEP